jgi:hypothetical protein
VEGISETIMDLVKGLQQIAPEVWRIAVRQVYAEVAGQAVILFVLLFLMFIALPWVWRRIGTWKDDPENIAGGIGVTVLAGEVFFAIAALIDAMGIVQKLVNPEWYAI